MTPSILKTGRPACHRLPLTSSLHRRHRLRAQRAPAKRVRSMAHSCPGRGRRHVRSWRKPTPHSKAHRLVNRSPVALLPPLPAAVLHLIPAQFIILISEHARTLSPSTPPISSAMARPPVRFSTGAFAPVDACRATSRTLAVSHPDSRLTRDARAPARAGKCRGVYSPCVNQCGSGGTGIAWRRRPHAKKTARISRASSSPPCCEATLRCYFICAAMKASARCWASCVAFSS